MHDRPVILFGGKGGVGKTTCSAAVAAWSAFSGKKTLVLTSDMTPSLSDIFQVPIGDRITGIAQNLFAFEISQEAIVDRWKAKFSSDFYDILSQLIDLEALDGESRHQLLDYIGSAPSLREETMLDLIVDMVETGGFQRIIWDTAPAGETLNLLSMPQFIRKHLTAGAKVFQGLDRIGKQLAGRRSISDTMDEWIKVSERISRFVRNKTAFVVVAKPEALVVRHAERLIKTLREYSTVILLGMVINGIIEDKEHGALQSMKIAQSGYITELRTIAEDLPAAKLTLSQKEIRGLKMLQDVGEGLCRQLDLM
jgi:arsenite-transporting ATPase